MTDYTNIIYNKKTGRVLIFETNGQWVIPSDCDLAHFENGVEPVMIEREDGVYLDPNTVIWKGWDR